MSPSTKRILLASATGFAVYVLLVEAWLGHGLLAFVPALIIGMFANIAFQRSGAFVEGEEVGDSL